MKFPIRKTASIMGKSILGMMPQMKIFDTADVGLIPDQSGVATASPEIDLLHRLLNPKSFKRGKITIII